MNKITLTGRIPSKKNSKIISCRGSRPMMFPSAKHKEWHNDVMKQLIGQPKIPKGTPIVFTYYSYDNRAGDLDNKWQSVADLFTDFGIIEDDDWNNLPDVHLKFGGVDKNLAGCTVEF